LWQLVIERAASRCEYCGLPLTPEGRVTEQLFHFNDAERVMERQRFMEAGLYEGSSLSS